MYLFNLRFEHSPWTEYQWLKLHADILNWLAVCSCILLGNRPHSPPLRDMSHTRHISWRHTSFENFKTNTDFKKIPVRVMECHVTAVFVFWHSWHWATEIQRLSNFLAAKTWISLSDAADSSSDRVRYRHLPRQTELCHRTDSCYRKRVKKNWVRTTVEIAQGNAVSTM